MISLRISQRIALAAYLVASVVAVTAGFADSRTVERASTPALMPLLAVIVLLARRRPRDRWIIATALLLAAAGDVALLWHAPLAAPFLFGAQVAYIVAFIRGGALDGLRSMPGIAIAYTLALVIGLVWLWSDLGAWRFVVAAYGLALAVAAESAATFGVMIGVGGGLFLLSDGLIAIGLAYHHASATLSPWAMLTYVAGQALVALGWTRVQLRDFETTAPAESALPAPATA